MPNNNPMARNTMYSNNPDILGKIGELDLAVKQLNGAPTGDYATKSDIQGMVKKVNNTSPDANGNVTIAIPSLTGYVKAVNGTNPDVSGNVTLTGLVKKVNNTAPDGSGNVTINLFPSGTTAQRPSTGTVIGQYFFDTTLNKPIYRNKDNNGWVDATGTAV